MVYGRRWKEDGEQGRRGREKRIWKGEESRKRGEWKRRRRVEARGD